MRLGVPFWFDEMTANGALADARQVSREFGNAVTEAMVRSAVGFLERFLAQPSEAS